MTTEEWYESVTARLLAASPFRRSEYFKRFASGTLTNDQVWGHIAQHYLLIAWFPRIFSGIHTRCEDLEEEVVEIARTVGTALVQHYGVRPDWGAANYTVHEAIEQEESGETKKTILGHIKTAEDRRAAEAAMQEMHDLLVAYADGLAR